MEPCKYKREIMANLDLILRNGLIVDGSGNIPYPGEVGICGKRIDVIAMAIQVGGTVFDREEAELSSQTVVAGTTGVLSHRKFSLKDALAGKAGAASRRSGPRRWSGRRRR